MTKKQLVQVFLVIVTCLAVFEVYRKLDISRMEDQIRKNEQAIQQIQSKIKKLSD